MFCYLTLCTTLRSHLSQWRILDGNGYPLQRYIEIAKHFFERESKLYDRLCIGEYSSCVSVSCNTNNNLSDLICVYMRDDRIFAVEANHLQTAPLLHSSVADGNDRVALWLSNENL